MSRRHFQSEQPPSVVLRSNSDATEGRPAGTIGPMVVMMFDPERLPDGAAEMLTLPDGDGFMHAVIGDRHFEPGSSSWSDALELRPQDRNEIADGPRWCPVCTMPFMFRGFDFFWHGLPVCDDCPPDLWKDIQRGGYQHARKWAVRLGVVGCDSRCRGREPCDHDRLTEDDHIIELWETAIVDYVEQLGETSNGGDSGSGDWSAGPPVRRPGTV